MSKVVYELINGTYYKLDQDPNVPNSCTKNISNSISFVERMNLNELELKVNISTINTQTTNSNREECNIMKSVLRSCPNIREIKVIPNRYKMKLTYAILDERNNIVDNSSTMRDVSAEDLLLALGVSEYNEALYRRVKLFSPRFKFLVRNIVPYGIMKQAKKNYTFLIIDISLYQQTVDDVFGENLHLSTYENPYSICSPCVNETFEDMILLYSTKEEGINYEPVVISYVPRAVYVNIRLMKDGYLSFYSESEIDAILDENKSKPNQYKYCDTVITVNNRVELNDKYPPETPELFRYTMESDDEFLPDERQIVIAGYGSANFGTITYTHPGVYLYTIKQTQGQNELYNYSNQVFKVRVTVTEHDFVLNAKTDVFDENGIHIPSIQFVNYYGIKPAILRFSIKNTIKGSQPVEPEVFNYILSENTENAPMPCINTTQITGDGVANTEPIEYKVPGVYKYTILQVPGMSENCVYDRESMEITVTSSKSGNEIVLDISCDKNEFINVYEYIPVDIMINIINTVIGDVPSDDETFNYKMVKVTSNAPDFANNTISIIGADDGNFGPINFNNPGYFIYQVMQCRGTDVHYEYDKSVFYVLFTVEDDYGHLNIKVEYALNYLSDKVGAIVFGNRYNELDDTTSLGNTTHIITNGTGKPDDNGYISYYSRCRATNPNALTVVSDDLHVDEYDDSTMVPKTCVLNDLPDINNGEHVIFNECITTTL